MSFTAKSIILDIATCWGAGSMGVRSVDFKLSGVLVDVLDSEITCYATSTEGGREPKYAFITALTKTGGDSGTSWRNSHLIGNTNHRLICVFTTAIEFDEVVVNNYHDSGGATTRGSKDVKITISTDAITSTVYNAAISNGTVIFDDQFTQHVASNVIDDQVLTLTATIIINLGNYPFSAVASSDLDIDLSLSLPDFSAVSSAGLAVFAGKIVALNDFNAVASANLDLGLNLSVPEFEAVASFDLDVFSGYFVILEPFNGVGSIDADIALGLSLAALDGVGSADLDLAVMLDLASFEAISSGSTDLSLALSLPPLSAIASGDLSIVSAFSYANPSILFFFTLTGAPDGLDDVQIPIKSFQARHRKAKPSFLAVTIPGTDYSDAITARSNGELVIRMAKSHAGSIYHTEEILRASLDEIRPDDGGRNKSITLSGYGTSTFSAKSVALQGVVYRSGSAGKLRFRLATPDIFLRPGDTAVYAGDEITVETISYTVDAQRQQMELAE